MLPHHFVNVRSKMVVLKDGTIGTMNLAQRTVTNVRVVNTEWASKMATVFRKCLGEVFTGWDGGNL